MKKAMISQPMRGLTYKQIKEQRERAVKYLEYKGYEVVDSYFENFDESAYRNIGVGYLAKSIECLATADVLYCCKGWENARGCVFEHDIAKAYEMEVIEE